MGLGLGLQLLVLGKLAFGSDDLDSVRDREYAVAAAITVNDESVLSSMTDRDFHLSWSYGSAVRNTRTDISRQEWMEGLGHVPIQSYAIKIESVNASGGPAMSEKPVAAYVRLNEFWVLRSPRGRRIEKRVQTLDLWVKRDGSWRLAARLCQSDPP
jgi:hypothetical protein